MATADFATFTVHSAQDPSLDPMMLEQLAHVRPDLHAAILRNPQCPAKLREWITSSAAASVFPPHAHLPAPAEPRAAAPAGVRAVPLMGAAFGIVGLISLSAPAISITGRSLLGLMDRTATFFSNGAQNTGGGIVAVMIIAIIAGLIGFSAKSSGARAAFGTIIMVCGIVGVIIAAVVINGASDYSSYGSGYSVVVEAASGAYLLLSTSICMALAGLFTLLKRNAQMAVQFEVSL